MQKTPHYYSIPVSANLWLTAIIILVNLFQWVIVPLWLLPVYGASALLTLIPYLLLTPLHWALIHEAIHKKLHPRKLVNEWLGRILSIPLFTSFYLLQFGHLMHHRFNRSLGHEFYQPGQDCLWRKNIHYYSHLFIGLYLFEVVASYLVALLPQSVIIRLFHQHCLDAEGKPLPELEAAGHRFFFRRNLISKVRQDMVIASGLLLGLCLCYSGYLLYVVILCLGRGLLISIHDNVYHYATAPDNSVPARELALPPTLAKGLLYFNYHHTHHLLPAVPWNHLPALQQMRRIRFDEHFGIALLEQCRGVTVANHSTNISNNTILASSHAKHRMTPV